MTAAGPSAGTETGREGPARITTPRSAHAAWRAADEAAREAAALAAVEEDEAELRTALSAAERLETEARFAGACASAAAMGAPSPMRRPAADSRLGELLLDVLPLACAVGHALDLHHVRFICGLTLREGVRRADGSLDRAGFLGGTADMRKSAARLQGLDAMRAEGREEGWRPTQLMRAACAGDKKRVRELVAAGAARAPWQHCSRRMERARQSTREPNLEGYEKRVPLRFAALFVKFLNCCAGRSLRPPFPRAAPRRAAPRQRHRPAKL